MIDGKDLIYPVVTWPDKPDWSEIAALCKGWITDNGIARLTAALGDRVKAVVVERQYIDRDYRDTFSNFHSKRFSTPDSRCVRLHFLSEAIARTDLRDPDKLQPCYLGYTVLRPTRPNCIGRTMIRPGGAHLAGAYACVCSEHVHLQGTRLEIRSFPFISQDTDVTVCAQSALWMALRYFSNKYPSYAELHPYEVGELTRDYSIGRLFPSAGLYTWQLAEVFRQARFSPVIYDRSQYGPAFDHLLYTYIESGIPVLVAFDDHVVAGFGHVSELSKAVPAGVAPICSSFFNRALIVHDDNRHPAEVLWDSKSGIAGESKYQYKDIRSFVVPLPERVYLAAECFHTAVDSLLCKGKYEYGVTSPLLNGKRLVLRYLLTTVRSFKRNLAKRGMGHADVEEVYRNLPLPHFIWVCEISDADLYCKDKKVWGEVIWDATRNVHEVDGWIALHYPEKLLIDVGSAMNGSQHILSFDLTGSVPYSLYENNLEGIQ